MKIMKPENYEGFLLKRRNWPMKGWHKRYFTLNEGILKYYKSKSDVCILFLFFTIINSLKIKFIHRFNEIKFMAPLMPIYQLYPI